MDNSSSTFSEEELEGYYRKEPASTTAAILSFLRDSRNPKMIVFGNRATNAHLPDWLDKETKDWDIVSTGKAEGLANKLESMLDRHYGGDFFGVESAMHPGTFRVRSKVTGLVVADISLKDRNIDFQNIQGVNYATLEWIEKEVERLLASPDAKFRRSKDMDTLQRIQVHKRIRGGKPQCTVSKVKSSKSKASRSRPSKVDRYADGSEVDTSMQGLWY